MTKDGIASLLSAKLIGPEQAEQMMACVCVQAMLPDGYMATSCSPGVDHAWVTVVSPWSGDVVEGDVSAELAAAVSPLAWRFSGVSQAGLFSWVVQAPEGDSNDDTGGLRGGDTATDPVGVDEPDPDSDS